MPVSEQTVCVCAVVSFLSPRVVSLCVFWFDTHCVCFCIMFADAWDPSASHTITCDNVFNNVFSFFSNFLTFLVKYGISFYCSVHTGPLQSTGRFPVLGSVAAHMCLNLSTRSRTVVTSARTSPTLISSRRDSNVCTDVVQVLIIGLRLLSCNFNT